MTDQWDRWRSAITNGTRVETERGNPASGFYKQNTNKPAPSHIEAICIYRDDVGSIQCIRTVYSDGSKMTEDEIDDLFGKVCIYPIAEDLYRAVTERGEAWAPEYATRLTMKDQAAGVAWTPEYGRKRLGLDANQSTPGPEWSTPIDAPENPRAIIGNNLPPEETAAEAPAADPASPGHTFAGERTPDLIMTEEVSALGAQVKVWLASIGGQPRNNAEADQLADYATRFKKLSTKAEDARKLEKQPHLDAERDIDARWKRPKSNADGSRKRCLELWQEWTDNENARLEAEVEAANAQAAAAAEKHAKQYDAPVTPPPPIVAEKITSGGNMRTVSMRTREVWVLTEPRAYLAHLLAGEGELPAEIVEAAEKVVRRRAMPAPGVEKQQQRSAA